MDDQDLSVNVKVTISGDVPLEEWDAMNLVVESARDRVAHEIGDSALKIAIARLDGIRNRKAKR